jgi:hypothetical protein
VGAVVEGRTTQRGHTACSLSLEGERRQERKGIEAEVVRARTNQGGLGREPSGWAGRGIGAGQRGGLRGRRKKERGGPNREREMGLGFLFYLFEIWFETRFKNNFDFNRDERERKQNS